MKFRSQVYTEASGSVGGLTYSHNKGGMYTRARRTPVNPSSARQVTARAAFQAAAQAWSATLTEAQRAAWSVYAANSPLSNAFGDPLLLSGQQMYVRCNSARIGAGLSRVDAGPTTFGEAPLTQTTTSSTGAALEIAYDNTDAWANEDAGALLIQTSRPVSPTINYLKSPIRLYGVVAGNATTAPASPEQITQGPFGSLYSNYLGSRVFTFARATLADGRLSPVIRDSAILTA